MKLCLARTGAASFLHCDFIHRPTFYLDSLHPLLHRGRGIATTDRQQMSKEKQRTREMNNQQHSSPVPSLFFYPLQSLPSNIICGQHKLLQQVLTSKHMEMTVSPGGCKGWAISNGGGGAPTPRRFSMLSGGCHFSPFSNSPLSCNFSGLYLTSPWQKLTPTRTSG